MYIFLVLVPPSLLSDKLLLTKKDVIDKDRTLYMGSRTETSNGSYLLSLIGDIDDWNLVYG